MSTWKSLLLVVSLVCGFVWLLTNLYSMRVHSLLWPALSTLTAASLTNYNVSVDLNWHAPRQTFINNLTEVIDGTGIYGFVFDSSKTPANVSYSTYNWCNMPHVRPQEYVKAPKGYQLEYVELIHRHHKRTPYASNTFPKETYSWFCDDESLFYYGNADPDRAAAAVNWQVYTSPVNPLAPSGFNGTCQFPQISSGGLLDSRKHGNNLFAVYHDVLNFLPSRFDKNKVIYRVTNNQITSQVASQIIYGMYQTTNHDAVSVMIQVPSVDSLEPAYSCPAGSALFSSYGVGSKNANWTAHLDQSRPLFSKLDSVSNIDASNSDWHNWFDHYYDNLSARLCHDKPLPCSASNASLCITREDTEAVFRRGQYEYSFIYRDSPQSLQASLSSYGIWIAELAANLRNVMAGNEKVIWRHNIAHDGSMSRLLSILQVDMMVWPGMGSELVFELYKKDSEWFLRVLWGGQVLQSSNPTLGKLNLVPVNNLLGYIDGLVGTGASKVPGLCKQK